jgi:hypothetical protein
LLIAVGVATTCAIWFAPVLLAYRRRVRNPKPIAVFTLLAGWTLVGWIAALIWTANAATLDDRATSA